ncbi:hypothetical protein BU15DRAFT_76285 [Melanogaster broomeanus]|nr:hypothetical protein BU15DRAFT_76285 [Melanogaster broomeanus]
MSNQLPEDFQKLQVTDRAEQGESFHGRSKLEPQALKNKPWQRSAPMELELPTHHRRRLQFYDYPVNWDWLRGVGDRKMKPKDRPFADDTCLIAYAMQLFRFFTRITTLKYEYVRNPGDAPPDCVNADNEVLIVSTCSIGPPRWWEDAEILNLLLLNQTAKF